MNDDFYMRSALQMAETTAGQTGVNPAVGCVIVKDGRVVGMGAHLRQGTEHAEIHALTMAGPHAEGSTVYVTLEPCSHFGRTPPCCDQLIARKVRKVVVASVDPNPKVAGSGIDKLKRHGIEVATGVLSREAERLNEAYAKYIRTGLPYVTLKTASTLDGKIASRTGDSRWITGDVSREYVHVLRHRHHGIMIGIGTLLADNPRLTTRLSVPGLNPIPIIVDARLETPPDAAIFNDRRSPVMILTTASAEPERRHRLKEAGADLIECGSGPRVDLQEAMRNLGRLEIGSILLEGGGRLNGAMLDAGLVDKLILFYAPKLIGGLEAPVNIQMTGFSAMSEALQLRDVRYDRFGDDLCIQGYPVYRQRK